MASTKKPDDVKITSIEFKNKGKIKVIWNCGSIESSITRDLPQHIELTEASFNMLEFLSKYQTNPTPVDELTLKKITFAHYEDKEGMSCLIQGVHSHPKSGQNTSMKTSKMQVHEEHYGFETNLKKAINVISEEAYQFAVNMKSAQLKVA